MKIQLLISFTSSNEFLINLMIETFRDDLVYVQSTSNGVGVHTLQESIPVLLHEGIRSEVLNKMRIIDIISIILLYSKHYDIILVLRVWALLERYHQYYLP